MAQRKEGFTGLLFIILRITIYLEDCLMNLKHYGLSLAIAIIAFFTTAAQDFSNKGTDFWVGYGIHARMVANTTGGTQDMVLYFATDVATNVTVSIPLLSYSQTYSIPANTIFTTNPIPKFGANDARLTTEGVLNKGIHITSDQPIVAYAHIYNGNVSGATLLFPTNTLGREYYSMNYTQNSNEPNSNCFFYAIAVDTGTTVVEVTPSANTLSIAAGQTKTYNLQQGQVLSILGVETNAGGGLYGGSDLTGSTIRSISSGTGGCKKIAVFSGAGKLFIRCGVNQNNSADNYMVQAFPKNAWGKYYLTVPTKNFENNYFRIGVSDPTTVVKLNGNVLSGLMNNFYYQVGLNNTPNVIEADKPIIVAQYITTQGACGNGNTGDPEVIYLSPVEQNISKVILNSTPNSAIDPTLHFVNVVIPNGGTAISSFKIDGATPSSPFILHPQNSAYSYLQQNVRPGQHTLQSDSGFNAIAYGYGSAESYGYNAGANVKDLYQFVSIKNQYATVNYPAACKNSPFQFSMTFPYQPLQIQWQFGGLLADTTIYSPVYDSTWAVNGKQLYKYSLPSYYTLTATGTFTIKVVAQNPTSDGCSGEQVISYDLKVYDRPVADFTFATNGCATDNVKFTDISNTYGRSSYIWGWNFGDGQTSAIQSPIHVYNVAGSFNVKFSLITDIGCLSDTVMKTVVLTQPPVAKFGVSTPDCINKTVTFTDSSTTSSSILAKWYWDFGDGTQLAATSNASQQHTYTLTGTFNVTLKVETATGCQSTVFTKAVIISPNPVASFTFGNACLPAGTMQFTNGSTISDGTQLSYQWNFGDGGISTQQNPLHNFTTTGPYNVTLTATSTTGCSTTITNAVNTIYAQPTAAFTSPAEVCYGTTVNFTDQSTAPNSTVAQWQWNFGDGQTSSQQNPSHNYASAGTYNVTLTVTSAIGCVSTIATRTVVVNALPTANFTTSAPDCETRNITFIDASVANSGNITQWSWNLGDGTTFTKTTNTSFTHAYTTGGSYNVTLQVQTDKGCVSTVLTKQVVVHPLPVPGFIMPGNCLTDPFTQFTDTSKIADGTQNQFTYSWNFGDQNANALNPNTSALQNPQHKYTAVGNYNVTLTVTSVSGCTATATQVFTINGTTPQSAFSIQGGNQQCSNNVVALKDNSTVNFGNVVKLEIYWDFANNPMNKTTVTFPPVGGTYSHTYPEFYTPATQNYTIKVIAYSGINCLNTSTQTITMMATPQVVFSALSPVCADAQPFQITQASVANNLPGSGTFNGNGVSSNGIFNPAVAGAGTFSLTYIYTGTNGCINHQDQTITVYPVPVVDAGPDRFMLEGGTTTLLATATGNGLTYLWTPNIALSNPAVLQPVATPPDDITYTLTVTSSDGCIASDQVFVKVLKAPTVPNVFTPNGDGINDTWVIQYLDSYPGATVQVFNRYGQKVFESVGYSKPWDGTSKGKLLSAGTYYYIIDPKNGRKIISGFVDIVR